MHHTSDERSGRQPAAKAGPGRADAAASLSADGATPLPADELLAAAASGPDPAAEAPVSAESPLCPVDRLPRRRRNELCIAVIALGMLNYVVYTIAYAALGGDAHNGRLEQVTNEHGQPETIYFVRGHFIHSVQGRERVVSKGVWVYSYLHSITVPLTAGAVIISMLVLARPHILATMRGGWISGETFVVALGTIVVLASGGMAVLFMCNMVEALWR